MKFKFPPFLLWFLVAAALNPWFSPAHAQSVEDYTVSIVVPDQSDEARDAALRDALKTVIRRISGNEAAASSRIAPLLGRVQTQIKQYSYASNAKDETQLSIVFDQATLDGELRSLGLVVWGNTGSNSVNEIALRINGVRSPQTYAKLLSTVRGLAGVKHIAVNEVGGGAVHLRVQSESSANKLAVALVNSRSFRRTDDGEALELGFDLLN